MEVELPAPVTTSDAACPVAIASSGVAPAATVVAIAYCASWAAIAASCASIFYVAAMLAAASTATCCLFISIYAFFSTNRCSSCFVEGIVL